MPGVPRLEWIWGYAYDGASTDMMILAACASGAASGMPPFSTGKERDIESGLDYFGARYYASNMGRFMSPDWSARAEPVPYSKLDDPQTLNLYAYVGNNPLIRVDADGHRSLQAGIGVSSCAGEGSIGCSPGQKERMAQQQSGYQAGNREANVIYHETSALQPVKGKSDSDDLHGARVGVAHVYNNLTNKSQFQDSGTLNSREQKAIAGGYAPAVRAYNDSVNAVSEAASGADTAQTTRLRPCERS